MWWDLDEARETNDLEKLLNILQTTRSSMRLRQRPRPTADFPNCLSWSVTRSHLQAIRSLDGGPYMPFCLFVAFLPHILALLFYFPKMQALTRALYDILIREDT